MRTRIACLYVAVILFAGCVANPKTPNLAGDWVFEAQTGENVAHGAMTLVADGASYKGTLTTDQTDNILPVRSLILQGSNMSMLVESPEGNITVKGTLADDAQTFQGKVIYFNGQTFAMSGRRR
ncbi:MAG TPA: hypothetical protein VL494_14580 [Steroidobacteraceae bacterium]|jgi:hypothetical protein|nr:hypothetical protein [Steroidobacteraceae bacterium]